jgi:hypothetical protein
MMNRGMNDEQAGTVAERIREERSGEESRGLKRGGQKTRTDDGELKHNSQNNVGMHVSPPFSNVEDEGQLQGQATR